MALRRPTASVRGRPSRVAAGALSALATLVGGASRLPIGWRPPGAIERPSARRRRVRAERRTVGLGLLAVGTTAAVAAGELARVWHRGSAPLPTETTDVLGAAEEAARQTLEVAVAAYEEAPIAETALLNMLAAFALTFGIVRASTHLIRARGAFGPFRNVNVGDSHLHHFVPGILLAFGAGGAALLSSDEGIEQWLALPFGVGVALTLDESALLLKLDDVYWTEEGIVSVQIMLATLASLSAATLATRVLRRGEERVLEEGGPAGG